VVKTRKVEKHCSEFFFDFVTSFVNKLLLLLLAVGQADDGDERRPRPRVGRAEDEVDEGEPLPQVTRHKAPLRLLRRLQDQGLRRWWRGEPHLPGLKNICEGVVHK
jgi:hypothetical protein